MPGLNEEGKRNQTTGELNMFVKLEIRVVLLAETDLTTDEFMAKVQAMELGEIAYEINDGDWVGSVANVGSPIEVPIENLPTECEALDADAGFFDDVKKG